MFIGFWLFITVVNIIFLIYDSIVKNYNVTFEFVTR